MLEENTVRIALYNLPWKYRCRISCPQWGNQQSFENWKLCMFAAKTWADLTRYYLVFIYPRWWLCFWILMCFKYRVLLCPCSTWYIMYGTCFVSQNWVFLQDRKTKVAEEEEKLQEETKKKFTIIIIVQIFNSSPWVIDRNCRQNCD